jgi:hypothetical protein
VFSLSQIALWGFNYCYNWQEFEGQKGYGYQIKSTVKNPRPEDVVFHDVNKFDRLAGI